MQWKPKRICFECNKPIRLHHKWTVLRNGITEGIRHRNCRDPVSYKGGSVKDKKDEGLSEARTEEDLAERDYPRRDITITIREVPGEFVKVQVGASKPIYNDELKQIWRVVETALIMVGIERPADPMIPAPKITINGIRDLVKEEDARKKILDESLEDGPPEEARDEHLMSEEELVLDLAERHGVDAQTVKYLRDHTKMVQIGNPAISSDELAEKGSEWGIPKTTAVALIEDLID